MARADDLVTALHYGFDARHLYLRADLREPLPDLLAGGPLHLGIYMTGPGSEAVSSFSRYGRAEPKTLLGFGARYELAFYRRGGGAAPLYRRRGRRVERGTGAAARGGAGGGRHGRGDGIALRGAGPR